MARLWHSPTALSVFACLAIAVLAGVWSPAGAPHHAAGAGRAGSNAACAFADGAGPSSLLLGAASLLFAVAAYATRPAAEPLRLRAFLVSQSLMLAVFAASGPALRAAPAAGELPPTGAGFAVALAALEVALLIGLGGAELMSGRAGAWLGAAAASMGFALVAEAWLPYGAVARTALAASARTAAAVCCLALAWEQCRDRIVYLKTACLAAGGARTCAELPPS